MYITPETLASNATAFLIHTPSDASGLQGHYDCALPFNFNSSVPQQSKSLSLSCRCGVNKTDETSSCKPSPFYATRCKCLKESKPCTSECKCRNCGNPAGVRPQLHVKPRTKRKHVFQQDVPTSKRFANECGEEISRGVWSDFESILLSEVITRVSATNEQDDQFEYNIITKLYNEVVYYSTAPFCIYPIESSILLRKKV